MNGDSINLKEYTGSVTGYINKCIEVVTVSREITIRANRKPWMTGDWQTVSPQDGSTSVYCMLNINIWVTWVTRLQIQPSVLVPGVPVILITVY